MRSVNEQMRHDAQEERQKVLAGDTMMSLAVVGSSTTEKRCRRYEDKHDEQLQQIERRQTCRIQELQQINRRVD